jgi:hypothetical protein
MYANGRFWMADRLPDVLMLVEMERKGCFGGRMDEFSRRMSTLNMVVACMDAPPFTSARTTGPAPPPDCNCTPDRRGIGRTMKAAP